MKTITLIEADGSTQTITSSSEFTSITGTDTSDVEVTLLPVATTTPVADPIVSGTVTSQSGVVTNLIVAPAAE